MPSISEVCHKFFATGLDPYAQFLASGEIVVDKMQGHKDAWCKKHYNHSDHRDLDKV